MKQNVLVSPSIHWVLHLDIDCRTSTIPVHLDHETRTTKGKRPSRAQFWASGDRQLAGHPPKSSRRPAYGACRIAMRCLSNIAAFVLYVYYEDGNVVSAAWPRHGNAAAEEAMQRQMQARAVCWAAPCTACKDAHLVPRESWPKTMPLPIDEFPESFDSALTFGNVSLTIAGTSTL